MSSIDRQDEASTLHNSKLDIKDAKESQDKRLIWKHLAQKKMKKLFRKSLKSFPQKKDVD